MDFSQAVRKFVFQHPPTPRDEDGNLLDAPAGQRTWELPRVNDRDVKWKYARFRQDKRKEFLFGHFATRNPDEYRIAMEVFQAGADDGTYAWRSESFYASLQDPENQIRLIWLWFQMVDKKITEQAVAEVWWEEVGQEKRPLRDLLYEMINERNPLFLPGANGQAISTSPASSAVTPSA